MARIPETGFRAGPIDHAIGFHIYPANALTDEKNIVATIVYDAGTGDWTGQPGNDQGSLSEVLGKTAGAAANPSLDALPPLHAAALLSAEDASFAPRERRYEAVVLATLEQIERIKILAGADNVSMAMIWDNGIGAFWSEGPELLEMLRQILNIEAGNPEADWNALPPEDKDTLISIAAGSAGWALDNRLDDEYVTDWFAGNEGALEAVRRRA